MEEINALIELAEKSISLHDRSRRDADSLTVRALYSALPAIRSLLAEYEDAVREIALIRKASQDGTLSDFSVRVIAAGTVEPSEADIEMARQGLKLVSSKD